MRRPEEFLSTPGQAVSVPGKLSGSLSRQKKIGVDALSVVSPYYVAVTQDDIFYHFSEVAKSTDLPIIIYNIPGRTGNNINYATVKRLSEFHNIVGVKDSSGNFDNTLRYVEDTDRRLSVLAGNDSLILWTLLAGGTGAIAGTANVFSGAIHRSVQSLERRKNRGSHGDADTASAFPGCNGYG